MKQLAESVIQTKKELERRRKQTARAAIMSRNMSHNLGSHALARIHAGTLAGPASGRAGGAHDGERLLQYMQERMDFLARVATEWPTWQEPELFFADLLRGFLKQGLLLDNLVADEGFEASKVTFRVKGPADAAFVETTWRAAAKNSNGAAATSTEEDEFSEFSLGDGYQDCLVAIPGGRVGRQAFYGFLENAIRNAAKHNSGNNLEVTLQVEEDKNNKRFYTVTYQDNLSPGRVATEIQKHLERDLIDEKGELVAEGWGIQEMKVYAQYLAHPHSEWQAPECPRVLPGPLGAKAQDPLVNGGGARGQLLTYIFGLQRPCLALVPETLVNDKEAAELARYGIETFQVNGSLQDLRQLVQQRSPGLIYLEAPSGNNQRQELLEELKANRLWLPARILLRPPQNNADQLFNELKTVGLAHRVRVDYESQSPADVLRQSNTNSCKPEPRLIIELYRRWLVAFAKERGYQRPFNLVIYFDRDDDTFPRRWAELKAHAEECGIGTENFIRVYPVHKKQTNGRVPNPASLSAWKVAREFARPPGSSTLEWGELCARAGEGSGQPGTWLLFDNHGKGMPSGLDESNRCFYQHIGSLKDFQNNREAFDRLANVPTGFTGVLFLLQLIESCLLKVLVLDERVASVFLTVANDEIDFKGGKLLWYSMHWKAGLRLAPVFQLGEMRLCHLKSSTTPTKFRGKDELPSLEFAVGENGNVEVRSCTVIGKDGWCSSLELANGPPCDVVVIHRGLMESLAAVVGGNEQFFSNFLDALHRVAARVIVTSGRGAQVKGPYGQYPFVEYSTLEATIVRELSKPSLGSVLMAVSGR